MVIERDGVEDEISQPEPKRSLARAHIWAAVLLAVALISIFVLARIASSPQVLSGVHESLDSQQATVSGLAVGATALSAALSLVPEDALTPVANQLADVSGWFMVIIATIILQKILVTVAGPIAFAVFIPLACVLGILYAYSRKDSLRSLGLRFAAFALVLFLAIPSSIWVSTMLTSTYTDITQAANAAEDVPADSDQASSGTDTSESAESGDGSFLDSIGDWMSDAVGNVGDFVGGALNTLNDIKDNAVDALNSYMEQFALLIVTTCVMPILVMLLFGWVIKLLFSIDIAAGRLGRTLQSHASSGVKSASRSGRRVVTRP